MGGCRCCQRHQKYVVANADEGDPGSFSDKVLLEQNPFQLIEAMIIAGLTVGATQGYIYLRREYPAAAGMLQQAIQQAYAAGWLGKAVLGSSHYFGLQLVIGHGSYLCGEETAMLNAIEGQRRRCGSDRRRSASMAFWPADAGQQRRNPVPCRGSFKMAVRPMRRWARLTAKAPSCCR